MNTDDVVAPAGVPLPAAQLACLGAVYVTGEESLRVTCFNTAAGVTVTITGRFLDLSRGIPIPFQETLTPTTNGAASSKTIRLGEGFLLNAQVVVTAGAPTITQCFATLSLIRGEGSAALEVATLAANFTTTTARVAFPGSDVAPTGSGGAGTAKVITGTTPAAGAEIAETVPAGKTWAISAIGFKLVTSAAVANRRVFFIIDDGTTVIFEGFAPNTVPATNTVQFAFAQGQLEEGTAGAGQMTGLIPGNLVLPAGARWGTTTGSIQAADQYSNIRYLVVETSA